MSDKGLRCWMPIDGNRVVEMVPITELERVRAQRDKFVRAWYSEADKDSDADKERWLAAEGLRLVNGKVEEIEGA